MTYIYRFTINETGQCYVGQHRSSCNDPYKDNYKGSGRAWTSLLKEYDLWEIKKFRKGVQKEILNVWYKDVSRDIVGEAEKKAIEETREIYGGLFSDFCLNIADGSLPSWSYDTQEEAEQAYKERMKKYREKHKEELKKYREEHKEEIKECKKKYREKHKEELKKYKKKYREENREKIKAKDKKYREEHKEEKKAKDKKYREEHKEEIKEYHKKYNEKYNKKYKENHKEEIKEYRQLPQVKLANKVRLWIHRNNYPSPEVAIFPKSWGTVEIAEYKRQWENRK